MVEHREESGAVPIDDLLATIREYTEIFAFDEALDVITKIRQTIDDVDEDWDTIVQLSIAEAKVRLAMGDSDRMAVVLMATETRIRLCRTPRVKAESYVELSTIYMARYDFKQAERFLETALEIARDKSLGLVEVNGLLQLARLNRQCFQFDAALFLVERALERLTELESRDDSALLVEKSLILKSRGDLNGALGLLRENEQQARARGDDRQLFLILLQESDLFRVAGDIDSAFRLVRDAHELPTFQDGLQSPEVIDMVGRILLVTKDYDEALDWYKNCEGKVRELRFFVKLPDVFLGYAQCWMGKQNYTKSLECLWQADDLIAGKYVDRWDIAISMLRALERILPHIQYSEYAHSVKSVLSQLESPGDPIAGLRLQEKDRAALNRQIAEVIKIVRTNKVGVFTRKGVRVDLNTGEVFHDKESPYSVLSPIQMIIFTHLVEKSPNPISNKQIVELYDLHNAEYTDAPRRGHYFISELRKKLGSRTIILTKRGSGYYIPD